MDVSPFIIGLPFLYEHWSPYFLTHSKQRLGSHRVVLKYFSPPSGAMATITPFSISFALAAAMWKMAPELGPTKIPSCKVRSREASSAVFWVNVIDFVNQFWVPDCWYVLVFEVF